MRHEFELERTGAGRGGTLIWDSASGDLAGDLAAEMEQRIAAAEQDGYVVSHPYPTQYSVTDPRHDEGDFAVVLSAGFKVPASLADALARRHPAPAEDVFDVIPVY